MTSRERVLAAVAHREGDRVPVDLGSTPSSGISALAYSALVRALDRRDAGAVRVARDARPRVYDVVQELAQPEDWMLDRLGIDVVDIGRAFNDRSEDWAEYEMPDGSPYLYPAWFKPLRRGDDFFVYDAEGSLLAQRPSGATFYDERCFPYQDGYPSDYRGLPAAMGKVLWSALVHSPWDHAGDEGFWKELRSRALALKAGSDRALMIVVGCNLFEWGTFLRRIDNFLVDLLIDEAQVEGLLDALMESHLATLAKVCEAVGDVADILRFGDDLGHEGGPFMSPETYRRIFKPRHKILVDYVRAHSSMKTFLHSCGSIYALIPDLIDAGYDILNPVQTSAKDMEPERLKREFGKDLTFWGAGIENRTVLKDGRPEDVRAQTLERLTLLSKGGGFVFNTVHNIMPDVPARNVLAMFDAVAEFNGQPRR
ncbi:MAG: uroporphyrinogen decarboxylase family protein [Rectinemataceae bacterium]